MSGTAPSLRIAHVVATPDFAGTERYVCDVATELARRGHRVRVHGGEPAAMRAALGPAVPWSPAPTTRAALASLVRGGRVDVVHSHLAYADFAASLASVVTGGRRISTRHIPTVRGTGVVSARVGRWVRGRLLEVAVSDHIAATVQPRSDAVIVNGVPPVDAPAIDSAHAPPTGTSAPVVLVAQRLVPEKGTDEGLRAWAASGLAERGWELHVAGRGPDEDRLRRISRELGVEASVRFLGWVDDVAGAMASAEVFLATSPDEPLGLSVLEAMARGTAVVATDAGGHRETVGAAPDAALYAPGDAAACGALLADLALDPARRHAYGARLRALQRERFTITGHVDALERLYRHGLAPAGAPAAGGGAPGTRVLYVIPGTGYGGAHNQVATLAPHLAAAGYATSVILPREPGDALERLQQAGVEVTTMPLRRLRAGRPLNNALLALTFPAQVLRLRRAVRAHRADTVQVHGVQQLDAALAARLAGATVVWQLLDTRAPRPLMRLLRPALQHLAHAVLVTGEATASAHGVVVGARGVVSYYPPVAEAPLTRTREEVRELLGVPPGAVLVGSLANLNPQKGHEHLLEGFLLLQGRDLPGAPARLRVRGGLAAGHDGYTRQLEALGQRVEPGARVVGTLEPGCTPRELIAALDVFVLPAVSRSEGLPTVIIEAMTEGVCVVASEVGGIPDLVQDGVTGLLVPPGSAPALADALQRLVTDAALRRAFADAGQQSARARFSVQDTLAAYLTAHRGAAQRAGRAPATAPR